MKKYLALLLALVMVLSLCACGNSAPAATEAPAAEPAAEPAADDLVSLAQAEGELVVYGSCEVKVSAGAGFIVALTGDVLTMPGLPKVPAAERIDVDSTGKISGLF